MRFLVQRVSGANVSVTMEEEHSMEEKHSMEEEHSEGGHSREIIGKIGKGLVVFVGINVSDVESGISEKIADRMVKKLLGLRIFSDENDKTNLNLKSVDGQLLIISQFTLYADCRKGNRPSFINAAPPSEANALYEYIIEKCRQEVPIVECGSFGAHMKVSLCNDGPFTVILDSDDLAV